MSWFILSRTPNVIDIFYRNNDFYIYFIFNVPPTCLKIEKYNDKIIKILYDGKIHQFFPMCKPADICNFNELPEGFRYGAHVNLQNSLIYKKDFWNYPNVSYKNMIIPYMKELRSFPLKQINLFL